jgi:integrase
VHPRDHGGRGEAEAALDAYWEEVANGNSSEAVVPRRTFSEVFGAYIEICRGNAKAGTIESYEHTLKRLPAPLITMDVADITAHDLDTFYAALFDQGYASATVCQTHAVVHAVFAQAHRWGWIVTNPAGVTRPLRDDTPEKRIASPSEVFQLVIAADAPREHGGEGNTILAVAILLAAVTGCRRGELCGLRWDDLDTTTRSIRVERQWVPGKGGQRLETPKSKGGTRTVYVDPEVFAVLDRFREQLHDLLGRMPDGWLLSYDGGVTPLRAKTLTGSVARLAANVGLKGITAHSFRRVAASQLVAAGVDAASAAGRMGNTIPVMLDRYVRSTDDRSVAAAGMLHERLKAQGLPIGELLV